MKIIELVEKLETWDDGHGDKVQIIRNPSYSEFVSFLNKTKHNEAKGILSEGNLYLWDGFYMTHDMFIKQLHGYSSGTPESNAVLAIFITAKQSLLDISSATYRSEVSNVGDYIIAIYTKIHGFPVPLRRRKIIEIIQSQPRLLKLFQNQDLS